MYKIYAAIIQKRLAEKNNKYITETQYGFRKHRSTAQALHIARRMEDLAEESGDNVISVFLDWEKAFDKVDQKRLIEALERLNVPQEMIDNIAALYKEPKFRVIHENEVTEYQTQDTGIRQGCPLSPYSFTLIMTVMFKDIHDRFARRLSNYRIGKLDGLNFSEILYADDTLLALKDTRTANLLIEEIEEESTYYNMQLNKGKCNYIAMNRKHKLKFRDGAALNSVEEATYLGGTLTKTVNPRVEIDSRIAGAANILRQLDKFWSHTTCSLRWKIQVFNAVIISKVIYGLETLQVTDSHAKKLDAFQIKGIRKILGMVPTFMDRTQTNELALQRANEAVQNTQNDNPDDPPPVKIHRISELLKKRKLTLLGHIIRTQSYATDKDPMHQISFENIDLEPREPIYRRKGRPRKKWIKENLEEAWNKLKTDQEPNFSNTQEQRERIREKALEYAGPFNVAVPKRQEPAPQAANN